MTRSDPRGVSGPHDSLMRGCSKIHQTDKKARPQEPSVPEAAAGGGTGMSPFAIQENGEAIFGGHASAGEAAQRLRKFQYESGNGDIRISTSGAAISTPAKTATQSTAKMVLLHQISASELGFKIFKSRLIVGPACPRVDGSL